MVKNDSLICRRQITAAWHHPEIEGHPSLLRAVLRREMHGQRAMEPINIPILVGERVPVLPSNLAFNMQAVAIIQLG